MQQRGRERREDWEERSYRPEYRESQRGYPEFAHEGDYPRGHQPGRSQDFGNRGWSQQGGSQYGDAFEPREPERREWRDWDDQPRPQSQRYREYGSQERSERESYPNESWRRPLFESQGGSSSGAYGQSERGRYSREGEGFEGGGYSRSGDGWSSSRSGNGGAGYSGQGWSGMGRSERGDRDREGYSQRGYGGSSGGFGSQYGSRPYWSSGTQYESDYSERGSQRSSFAGRAPKGYKRSDERIREDVCDRLTESDIDCEDVQVSVKDGEVTLSGSSQSGESRRALERIAERVHGVKDVINQVRTRRDSERSDDGKKTLTPTGTGTGTDAKRGQQSPAMARPE